jgi:hypothetical protein
MCRKLELTEDEVKALVAARTKGRPGDGPSLVTSWIDFLEEAAREERDTAAN